GKVCRHKDPLEISDDEASAARRGTTVETRRLDRALAEVKSELRMAAHQVSEQMSEALAEIFRAHELMLDSLLSSREFYTEIESSGVSAELAVRRVFQRWEAKFLRIEDSVFRSKADDLADLFRKILQALRQRTAGSASDQI